MSPASQSRADYPSAASLPLAVILGCSGTVLTNAEQRFFRELDPLGFILFQRNCETPDQVRALTRALRDSVGRDDAPILIDQEGGRVARLKPPHWPKFPPMRVFGDMLRADRAHGLALQAGPDAGELSPALEAAMLNASLIAYELASLGVTVNCAPVADLYFPDAHGVVGDRAFDSDPELVAQLATQVCFGLQIGGVVPVIKHIPGHGRAPVDSHADLPNVTTSRAELIKTDFHPFWKLAHPGNAGLPWAMVAHVKYSDIDAEQPASTSRTVIEDVIRIGMGFPGVLIADDIGMHALSGGLRERAEATLAAGNDLTLHCSGKLDEMELIAPAITRITPATYARLAEAAMLPFALSRHLMPEVAFAKRARLRELIPGYGE